MTSYPITGEEEKFLAVAPSHLVVQDKEDHSVRLTIDYTILNSVFSQASNTFNPIETKDLEIRSYKYVVGIYVYKQYYQILNHHALSQCILRQDNPNDPLDVYVHSGLIMGQISSSSLAGYCMIQTRKIFDELFDNTRTQILDYSDMYPPLSYAPRKGILKPSSLPEYCSLEKLIRESLYAGNLIICTDST